MLVGSTKPEMVKGVTKSNLYGVAPFLNATVTVGAAVKGFMHSHRSTNRACCVGSISVGSTAGSFVRSASLGSPPERPTAKSVMVSCMAFWNVSVIRAWLPRYSTFASTSSGKLGSRMMEPSLCTTTFKILCGKLDRITNGRPRAAAAGTPFPAAAAPFWPKGSSSNGLALKSTGAAGVGCCCCCSAMPRSLRSEPPTEAVAGAAAAVAAAAAAAPLPSELKFSRSSLAFRLSADSSALLSASLSTQSLSIRLCDVPVPSRSSSSVPFPIPEACDAPPSAAPGDGAASSASSPFMCMMLMNFSM
mmetsp:Transcript_4322/g.16931  ORF Transcript_4322/g.16931 Transcript_4322/m.16931 type:complete len:304 (+) Transcript_4322:703-1614(+)